MNTYDIQQTTFQVEHSRKDRIIVKYGNAEFFVVIDNNDGSFRFEWDTSVSIRPNASNSYNIARR